MNDSGMAPVVKRVRGYFAPVQRENGLPTVFDPSQAASFALDAAPAPWVDLGWIDGFVRRSTTQVTGLNTGAPATVQTQVRSEVGAEVELRFESWGKLQMALSCGTQQFNVLLPAPGAAAAVSGAAAVAAAIPGPGSTAAVLQMGAAAANFTVGSYVAVDVDCTPATTGYVGSGVRGAYLRSAVTDVDYIRRVSLNVAQVRAVSSGAVTLTTPLPAGVPVAGMKVSPVIGFCDREGSSFFQEWSAVFAGEGQQGERVFWYYPRLQSQAGTGEDVAKSMGGYDSWQLRGHFRALPVVDPLDGERVVCFRTFTAG